MSRSSRASLCHFLKRASRAESALTPAKQRDPLTYAARGDLPNEQREREGEAPSGFAGGGGDASPYSRPDRFRTLDRDAFDVIVIGAGTGGLTAAALLARRGRSVLRDVTGTRRRS
jgi:NADPH-dependent 2,4-dienoyl-CoA reductase/sulfur reductase-like enzyme